MKKSDILWLTSFSKTEDGKKIISVLSELCEVLTAVPSKEDGSVCPNAVVLQAGKRSVFNKLKAFIQLGDQVES